MPMSNAPSLKWMEEVRTLLRVLYGIDIPDLGLEPTDWLGLARSETPETFVRRMGEKYDLSELSRER